MTEWSNILIVAGKLKRCQESARRLYGDEYSEKIKPYIEAVNSFCAACNTEPLKALPELLELPSVKGNGLAEMLFVAAVVDIIELP
jgi:hypothetical protein